MCLYFQKIKNLLTKTSLFMSSFLNKMQTLVNHAENVNDLIGILQHIPLLNLKGLINESLKLMNSNTIKSIYFQSCPINDIISDDVVKSMVSYIPYEQSLKYVNK
eukprot:478139_1